LRITHNNAKLPLIEEYLAAKEKTIQETEDSPNRSRGQLGKLSA